MPKVSGHNFTYILIITNNTPSGKRAIKAISVKCDNVERGCTWVGTVGTLEEHVATCQFTLLPCPKECKDDSDKIKQFMRKDLDKHLEEDCPNRDYSCQHCREKGTYASIQVHDKTCKNKEVSYPEDGCSEKVQRKCIRNHILNTCEQAIISCKYIHAGCEVQLKRKDMAAHELDYETHLKAALDTISLLRQESHNGEPVKLKFKLKDYQKKKEENRCVRSPSYYTSPNGYHMAIDVDANGYGSGEGTHVSAFAKFLEGNYDAQLKWPYIGKVIFTLLNQLEDKSHHQVIMELRAEENTQAGGTTWGKAKFIPHSELDYDAVNNTQYLKDDTLYFRMSAEPADHKPWLQ